LTTWLILLDEALLLLLPRKADGGEDKVETVESAADEGEVGEDSRCFTAATAAAVAGDEAAVVAAAEEGGGGKAPGAGSLAESRVPSA
jgi:hypothetical protein